MCERLLIGFLEAASSAGAALSNYAPVRTLSREGGRIRGAVVRDLETGTEAVVRARMVVNAAGPDVGSILGLAGIGRPEIPLLHAANDSVTPTEQSIEMFKRAGQPTELHLISDADHFMFGENNSRVWNLLRGWLADYFPISAGLKTHAAE